MLLEPLPYFCLNLINEDNLNWRMKLYCLDPETQDKFFLVELVTLNSAVQSIFVWSHIRYDCLFEEKTVLLHVVFGIVSIVFEWNIAASGENEIVEMNFLASSELQLLLLAICKTL